MQIWLKEGNSITKNKIVVNDKKKLKKIASKYIFITDWTTLSDIFARTGCSSKETYSGEKKIKNLKLGEIINPNGKKIKFFEEMYKMDDKYKSYALKKMHKNYYFFIKLLDVLSIKETENYDIETLKKIDEISKGETKDANKKYLKKIPLAEENTKVLELAKKLNKQLKK